MKSETKPTRGGRGRGNVRGVGRGGRGRGGGKGMVMSKRQKDESLVSRLSFNISYFTSWLTRSFVV
jgi:hypothetical protein